MNQIWCANHSKVKCGWVGEKDDQSSSGWQLITISRRRAAGWHYVDTATLLAPFLPVNQKKIGTNANSISPRLPPPHSLYLLATFSFLARPGSPSLPATWPLCRALWFWFWFAGTKSAISRPPKSSGRIYSSDRLKSQPLMHIKRRMARYVAAFSDRSQFSRRFSLKFLLTRLLFT